MNRTEACLVLNLIPKLGPRRIKYLLHRFGDPEAILQATASQLRTVERMSEEMAHRISHWEEYVDLKTELELVDKFGAHLLCLGDPDYPESLAKIYDPPLVLYVRGKWLSRDQSGLALVGSRNATSYGLNTAKKLGFQLGISGYTVISGLARGIDTAAHEGALAGQGRTIAVIGAGLGKLYPPENRALADRIAEQGAVMSEFPILFPPDYRTFPMRNRIVSALSQGIVVVEAPLKSGALITVQQGLDQGKAIYAIPGTIDRISSQGCNRLIQQGAKLVMGVEDILEECDQLFSRSSFESSPSNISSLRPENLSDEENRVFSCIEKQEEAIHMNTLVELTGLATSQVSVALMRLEMKGILEVAPGKWISKKDRWKT